MLTYGGESWYSPCPRSAAWFVCPRCWSSWRRTRHQWWDHELVETFYQWTEATDKTCQLLQWMKNICTVTRDFLYCSYLCHQWWCIWTSRRRTSWCWYLGRICTYLNVCKHKKLVFWIKTSSTSNSCACPYYALLHKKQLCLTHITWFLVLTF